MVIDNFGFSHLLITLPWIPVSTTATDAHAPLAIHVIPNGHQCNGVAYNYNSRRTPARAFRDELRPREIANDRHARHEVVSFGDT
jgi:hypothetical protein